MRDVPELVHCAVILLPITVLVGCGSGASVRTPSPLPPSPQAKLTVLYSFGSTGNDGIFPWGA